MRMLGFAMGILLIGVSAVLYQWRGGVETVALEPPLTAAPAAEFGADLAVFGDMTTDVPPAEEWVVKPPVSQPQQADSAEPIPAQTVEVEPVSVNIGKPFNSESAAGNFAAQIATTTGLTLVVENPDFRVYQVVLKTEDEAAALATLKEHYAWLQP